MATASKRNPTSRPTRISKSKSTTSTTDQLADELATRLVIDSGKGKGKEKIPEKDDATMRLDSMKAVNAASQTLSGVVQTGWKRSANPASQATLSTVNTAISTCAKCLAILRKISPDDLDVERAALSVLGKLVTLEMSDAALTASGDMHQRLVYKLVGNESSLTRPPSPPELLFLPLPTPPLTDTTLLNIISSYFCYTLTALTQTTISPKILDSISKSLATPNKDFALEWISAFTLLPTKHKDSVLTRIYSSLVRLCSSPTSSNPLSGSKGVETPPLIAFNVRAYALKCLGSTSPGVIESNNFWDQALKFTKVLVKSTPRNEDAEMAASEAILKFNSKLLEVAQRRPDNASFLACDETNVSFAAFCEYWTIFARKAGDVGTLQMIDFLMKKNGGPSVLASPVKPSAHLTPTPQIPEKQPSIHVEAARIFNTLSQGTLVMETLTKIEEDIPEVSAALLQLTACVEVLNAAEIQRYLRSVDLLAGSPSKEEATLARLSGKIDRVFERLRRYALRLLEAPSSRTEPFNESIRILLDACVSCMQITIADGTHSIIKDNANRALDTLFSLSRTRLNAQDPNSYLPAYDYLKLAQSIVDILPSETTLSSNPDDSPDVPNYLRCISGAHYNIAGTLYQITRYGNAVPFLLESCILGGRALHLSEQATRTVDEARAKEWTQLEEQLYRRWELLAICYSKNGDKKNAYHAYTQAIHSFPFDVSGLTSQASRLPSSAIFDTSSSASGTLGQLTSLVDRVTHIGTCELLLSPEEVSLLSGLSTSSSTPSSSLVFSASHKVDLPPAVVGIILERQLDYLDGQRGKDGVKELYVQVLKDALTTYDIGHGVKMPVKRSRILVRSLEFLYRESEGGICNLLGYGSVEAMADEVEDLLTSDDLGDDTTLNAYIPQYRITAHLWAALHAHKRADNEQSSIMKARSEQACTLVKDWIAHAVHHTPRVGKRISSPKFGKRAKAVSPRVARVAKVASPRPTRVTRSRAPPPAPRKAPARSRAGANPVTPKNKGRAVSQTVTIDAPRTPPRPSLDAGLATVQKSSLIFDEFDKLLSLFQLTSRILGLLSLILQKAQVLEAARKLSQHNNGIVSDAFVTVSIDLAQEYVALGKLRRAATVFNQALDVVRSGQISIDVSVRFILRYAEALAAFEDVPKGSTVYLEAFELSKNLDLEQRGQSTVKKIYARSKVLEITAMATHTFASLQYCNGDVTSALDALIQSLRLWTRAVDTLARLSPTPSTTKDSDPFDMGNMKDALTGASGTDKAATPPTPQKRLISDGLEWRLSEGLLNTLFSLTELYFLRGSAKEAEYFIKQATELAKELNAPSMISKALAKKAEIHLYLGQTEDALLCIMQATEIIKDVPGVDAADVQRLHLEYNERCSEVEDASKLFEQTVSMLEELNTAFQGFDATSLGPRRSSGVSRPTSLSDTLAPDVLASLFRKQLWNMRDEMGDSFDSMLEKLLSLSSTSLNKAEENSLMARLTLHSVYGRFRTDLFLSSLTESTIAVPMGMLALGKDSVQVSSSDIMDALGSAEKLLWSHLQLTAMKGNVVNVRQAALSLALIHGFRTSLGDKRPGAPNVMAALLDNSVALSLRREMIEVIDRKFPEKQCLDDMQWPLLSADGSAIPRSAAIPNAKLSMRSLSDSEDEEDDTVQDDGKSISNYWDSVRKRYQNQTLDLTSLSSSEMAGLPSNWTVISVNVTEDKNTLFISRQEGGSEQNPLIFCVPLNGRRDQEDEDHLSFDAAKAEMLAIIDASDSCIKNAVNVKDSQEAARGWWKERGDLDSRLRQLLENMEYCWLGAFKTILNPRVDCTDSEITELRTQFEKVFHRALHIKEKRTRGPSTHKKSMSQPISQSPADLVLDDFLIRCFSTLSPKCRDEEIEDVIYFILDLYQFHGVPIAIAEVDVDRLVVDLRSVLDEHSAKTSKHDRAPSDEHLFLVLDKNVQGFPWESMPILRGRSVSRIPGVQFLHDRLAFAKWKRESIGQCHEPSQGAAVDPRKGYYILNPSGDLVRTEERFRDWTASMVKLGWEGVAGKPVSEQQFFNALKTQDLVVYFGHGGGEQYIRSYKIRSLPTCAATMLWGCSSGALREMGDFDRTGTPHNYMLAGCPTLVANLWDVTDKDIDKFSLSVFDKLSLNGKPASTQKKAATPTSLVTAVAQSRDSCKLKYLTGAAPIVYGIPFYL